MFVTIESSVLCGMECIPVRVEVDVARGFPCFEMVGFLGSEVREAKERVRVALKNIGMELPAGRITVNLAPADVPKAGTAFDLPIAIGILAASGQLDPEKIKGILMAGEVGLGGEVRPIRGVLPMVKQARERGIIHCIIPKTNEKEGGVTEGIKITGVSHLRQTLEYLTLPEKERDEYLPPVSVNLEELFGREPEAGVPDFAEVSGQESVKRAVEVAAAGFHHILLIGPPGAGKTMLAKRIPGILPPLSIKESLEISAVYSVAGLLKEENALITTRPFLSPHHTISEPALVGGGKNPRPGMVSLAHHAVLFLDELGEFKRRTLDILRQPLEEKRIQIARVNGSYTYPADFMLAAAMNPCPCGYYPDRKRCRCSEQEINRYLGRISGPILDRIDICAQVPSVKLSQLSGGAVGERSRKIRERVLRARERQKKRYEKEDICVNSQLGGGNIQRYCALGAKEEKLLETAFQSMGLSARAYHRILKVARTIADLEDSEEIREIHLTEAICYRLPEWK